MGKFKELDIEHDSYQNEDFYSLIRKNSLYILFLRTIAPIINFLITIYIIRELKVNDYGIYNVLLAVMAYVSLFSSLGFPHILQRFVPEFFQKSQVAELKKLVQRGLMWRIILCGGIISIILIFSQDLGDLFKFREALRYLTIFSIAIIFYLESDLLSITLTSVFQHKKYVFAQISYVLLRAGILYYLIKIGKGLIGLLIAESIAYCFQFLLLAFFYRRFLSKYPISEKSDLPVKRLLRFGGYSYLYEIGSEILAVSTDFFIISAFLGPAAVGIYAFANRVIKQISRILPHTALVKIIRPVFFTKYTQQKASEQLNKMFNFLLKIIAFFTFPVMAGIIVLGDKLIIYVFDPKYLESLNILWIVAAFTVLNFFMEPIGLVLQATERVQILFFSKIFAIYNLVANILVVETYGVIGIAVVTGSAVLFKNLFCYFFAKKYNSLSVDLKGICKIVINSILMGLILYPVSELIIDLFTFVLVGIVGLAIYLIIAHFNKAFSPEEREIVNKILSKPIFMF